MYLIQQIHKTSLIELICINGAILTDSLHDKEFLETSPIITNNSNDVLCYNKCQKLYVFYHTLGLYGLTVIYF